MLNKRKVYCSITACHGDMRITLRESKVMSQNTTVFRHLQPLFQAARGWLPRITDTASDHRSARVTVEPYMDSLPTRRLLPRSTRARRFQGFVQMSIDA